MLNEIVTYDVVTQNDMAYDVIALSYKPKHFHPDFAVIYDTMYMIYNLIYEILYDM